MDEGWTRFVLEQHEFAFTTVLDADIRAGRLAERFDVIVLADSPAPQLLNGYSAATVPPEFAAGFGTAGAAALEEFVRGGGTLVTLDSASDLPIDLFGIGIRNVLKNVSRSEYFCPGGLLRATADPADPLVWGMPANFTVFAERGPAFDLTNGDDDDDEGEESPAAAPVVGGKPRIAARFAEKDVLYSGWLLGEGKIAKKGIVAEVPLGKGRVIMLAFRAQFRGQPLGTFKILFNALLPHPR